MTNNPTEQQAELERKVNDVILLGLANHSNEFLNPGFAPGLTHEELTKILERIMKSRLNERIMQLFTQELEKQIKEANSSGHWWTHGKRLDAYWNEAHYCKCGYKARNSDAIKGHVEWKKAELKETPHETS